jgi:CheY-like chemotaxis protein
MAAAIVMALLSAFVVSCASANLSTTTNVTRETIHVRLPAGVGNVDVYWPDSAAPAPMVIVAHGFMRDRRNMSGWGYHLAKDCQPRPQRDSSQKPSRVLACLPIEMKSERHIYIGIVDDDESLCRSYGRFLRASHFQAITYDSAEAFLEDTRHPHFDCLVLDIQLGGISGLDLARRLLAVKDKTPVVFITAFDDPEVRAQAEAIGCAAYFRKTESGADVVAAIRRAIDIPNGSQEVKA